MGVNVQYILSVVTAVIEGVCFSGLIFGWSSIAYVFTKEGYFLPSSLDVNGTVISCQVNASTDLPTACQQEQSLSLILVFTIASTVLSISSMPNGLVFDVFGTLVARSIATLFFTLGCVLIALSDPTAAWILHPAMCCIAVGGILLLITNMQLGNLFPSMRSSLITLFNGSLDSSSVIFLLVKIAYDNGLTIQSIFTFIAACSIFQWIRSFLLMPRMHVPFNLPKSGLALGVLSSLCKNPAEEEDKQEPTQQEMKLLNGTKNAEDEDPDATAVVEPPKDEMTFAACVRTVDFWMNVFHFSLLQLRNYIFLSTIGDWLGGILGDDNSDEVFSKYINAFGICQFFGIFCAPLNGILIDAMLRICKKSNSEPTAVRKAIAMSLFTTTMLGALFSFAVCVPNASFQYVSFILQVVFRSFLYGGNSSFIALLFPGQHFGKLYGLTMTVGGIIGLLQIPLSQIALKLCGGNFVPVNIAFIVISFITLAHPISLYFRAQKIEKSLLNLPDESINNGKHDSM